MVPTKRTLSRREFLKCSAAACAATYFALGNDLLAAVEPADLVLRGGKVITVDAENRFAQAVAMRDGHIVAVGPDLLVNALIGPGTRVVDLGGRTVTPGIVDSHIHPLYYGRQFWPGFINTRWPFATTLNDLTTLIAARAQTTPAGQWISGNQGFAFTSGPRHFDKTVLDAVAPNHPVYLRHFSGQYSVVNSQALQLAGIDATGITPDPYGGKIARDPATDEPTGVLLHYPAQNLVMTIADGYGDLTAEEMEDDVKRAQDMLLAAGVTSGQDVIVGEPSHLHVYKRLDERGELKMRMYLLLYINTEEQAQEYVAQVQGYESDMLKFAGWKLALDGGVQAGTSLMYDTSLAAAANSYYYYPPDVLNRIVRLLHETEMQISFHIIGDKGVDQALDALEAAGAGVDAARHRIEHAFFVQPSSLQRIKDLGVVVSTQPQLISWYGDGYRQGTSDDAIANFMRLKTMHQMGIPLAFGCDVPAAQSHLPRWAFVGASWRKSASGAVLNANECLDVPTILRIHTMGSAYAAFDDNRLGSIEAGKLADLVVWNEDPYSMSDPSQMGQLAAIMTIVNGQIVAQRAPYKIALPLVQNNS